MGVAGTSYQPRRCVGYRLDQYLCLTAHERYLLLEGSTAGPVLVRIVIIVVQYQRTFPHAATALVMGDLEPNGAAEPLNGVKPWISFYRLDL